MDPPPPRTPTTVLCGTFGIISSHGLIKQQRNLLRRAFRRTRCCGQVIHFTMNPKGRSRDVRDDDDDDDRDYSAGARHRRHSCRQTTDSAVDGDGDGAGGKDDGDSDEITPVTAVIRRRRRRERQQVVITMQRRRRSCDNPCGPRASSSIVLPPSGRRGHVGGRHASLSGVVFLAALFAAFAVSSLLPLSVVSALAVTNPMLRIRPTTTTAAAAGCTAAFASRMPPPYDGLPLRRRRRAETYAPLAMSNAGSDGDGGDDDDEHDVRGSAKGGGRRSGGKQSPSTEKGATKKQPKPKQQQPSSTNRKRGKSNNKNNNHNKGGATASTNRAKSKGGGKTSNNNNNNNSRGKNPKQKQSNSSNNAKRKGSDGNDKGDKNKNDGGGVELLKMIADPYRAGSTLRRSVDAALGLASSLTGGSAAKRLSADRRSIYYDRYDGYCVDDRLGLSAASAAGGGGGAQSRSGNSGGGAVMFDDPSPPSSVPPPSLRERERVSSSSSTLDDFSDDFLGGDRRPEVLIVGAAGEVGRLVAKRLLLEKNVRVRVLVRDLYSSTLERLGTGVTYCQGDLNDVESLEYAVTDVDKIVFCAGPPRSDEEDFRSRFREYWGENRESHTAAETIDSEMSDDLETAPEQPTVLEVPTMEDIEWDEMESMIELRARLAENVDLHGLRNLVHAYQNVRHADYGTSQAAKRSLFKFRQRPEDFNLFGIDDDAGDDDVEDIDDIDYGNYDNNGNNEDYGNYDDYENNDGYGTAGDDFATNAAAEYEDRYEPKEQYDDRKRQPAPRSEKRFSPFATWKKNKFGHGVFTGRVRTTDDGGEAALASAILRSRNEPSMGIDLRSGGFAGLVCRLCSNGGVYECFVRTEAYERLGVEYVCEFETRSKPMKGGNRSTARWATMRLEFADFEPMVRQRRQRRGRRRSSDDGDGDDGSGAATATETLEDFVPPFDGRDVRQIGFRYRGARNLSIPNSGGGARGRRAAAAAGGGWSKFYLALDFVKVYRSQPEPEFIYLSDARIPPVVRDVMIRHDARRLAPQTSSSSASSSPSSFGPESSGSDQSDNVILDEETTRRIASDKMDRSAEETYFKYRGEEIIKHSGLSYTIVRVAGYNELPSTDSSGVRLQKHNEDITPVSRADVAQVCSSALLEPNACNLVLYMTKTNQRGVDGDLWQKFARLRSKQTFQ